MLQSSLKITFVRELHVRELVPYEYIVHCTPRISYCTSHDGYGALSETWEDYSYKLGTKRERRECQPSGCVAAARTCFSNLSLPRGVVHIGEDDPEVDSVSQDQCL